MEIIVLHSYPPVITVEAASGFVSNIQETSSHISETHSPTNISCLLILRILKIAVLLSSNCIFCPELDENMSLLRQGDRPTWMLYCLPA